MGQKAKRAKSVSLNGSIRINEFDRPKLYVNLRKLYQAKVEADFLVAEQRVRDILKKVGRDPYRISKAVIKSFSLYNDMDEEIFILKTTAVGLLSDLGCNGSTLTEDLINKMCRYGAAVAAYVGGVASQEIIKVSTKGVYSTVLVSEHSTGYVDMEYLKAKVMDKDLRG
ncbi:NEDD8-activating enzyme E1 regulatory subunit AXR1 [Tanacetum coccineum]